MRTRKQIYRGTLTLALAIGVGSACGAYASQPPLPPSETPDVGTPKAEAPYTIDFITLGDAVTGALRRDLEGFTREVKEDSVHYTKIVIDRANKKAIFLSVDMTRATAGQTPTIYRIKRRVFLGWSSVNASDLMGDARSRHGGKPRCESVVRDTRLGKGTALTLEAFDRSGAIDLASDSRTRARQGNTADVCLWGQGEIAERGAIACNGACMSALAVHPLPGVKLIRLEEVAYDPSLVPATQK